MLVSFTRCMQLLCTYICMYIYTYVVSYGNTKFSIELMHVQYIHAFMVMKIIENCELE